MVVKGGHVISPPMMVVEQADMATVAELRQQSSCARAAMPEIALWEAAVEDAVASARALAYGRTPVSIGTPGKDQPRRQQEIEALKDELERFAKSDEAFGLSWICEIVEDLTKTAMDKNRIRAIILDGVARSRQKVYGGRQARVYSLAKRRDDEGR